MATLIYVDESGDLGWSFELPYNYMLKLLLLDEMVQHSQVTLIPDPRSGMI